MSVGEPFPLGFPFPTAFYLALYVLTLAVHVVFMNYVIAGSAIVAADALARLRARGGPPSPLAATLRDWLPFSVGAAITAGVAPLLFIQILYARHFYSANLLLSHRWMAILPVLVAGFYLVYLQKTDWLARRSGAWRLAVSGGALACFAFTGYSWTENHLLATAPSEWPGFYAARQVTYWRPELVPRLLLWLVGAVPTTCLLLGWQLRRALAASSARRLATLAIAGGLAAAGCAALYHATAGAELRAAATTPMALPYLVAAAAGGLLQGAAWVWIWRRGALSARALALASAGLFCAIVGMTVVREALRISSIDIAALYEQHARAAGAGGIWVFVVALALNAGLIAWCIVLARRGRAAPPAIAEASEPACSARREQ